MSSIEFELSRVEREINQLYVNTREKYQTFLENAIRSDKDTRKVLGNTSIGAILNTYGPLNSRGGIPNSTFVAETLVWIHIKGNPKMREFIDIASIIRRVYKLAGVKINFAFVLNRNDLHCIEALPQVKESCVLMKEAYEARDSDAYKAAFDLFTDACLDSYLKHVGIISQDG